MPASFNWKGFIFTWSISPNESVLLDNNISIHALSMYRNYLMSDQVVIPISIENYDDISDERICREYTQIINAGFNKKNRIHLGKRTQGAGFLKDIIGSRSNISWFRDEYPEKLWNDMVNGAKDEAHDKAYELLRKRSNIRGACEEMERILSARVANSEYYGMQDSDIEDLKNEQSYIMKALNRPRIVLDSVAFVWMEEKKDAESTN